MIFKRKEGFRFAFGEPIDANYVVLVNGRAENLERSQTPCRIIDISPRGMKIFSKTEISGNSNQLIQVEVFFILDETMIRAVGEITWAKPYGNGFHYGLIFDNQPLVEELIVSELKLRRKKEVKHGKTAQR